MTKPIHNSQFTIHNSQLENPNLYSTSLFVEALAYAGLTAVCIAPGSRSTPLALAFAAHPGIRVYRHLDERSAGFFALGLALATDRPAALVCTSGTAAANFFPAIIEAKMSQVPLLVLTADRPHELRHSGANQTIDQVKLYGDQVLWAVDMPIPQADAPEAAQRHVQTTAVRAYATANGLVKGPVHVNFPFRKPLEPAGARQPEEDVMPQHQIDSRLSRPYGEPAFTIHNSQFTIHNSQFTIHNSQFTIHNSQFSWLSEIIASHARGLIICGPRSPGGNFPHAAAALSRQSGYPILADPLSGVRFGEWVTDTVVLSGYETFLQTDPGWPEPELILRFGAVPTSKWLNAYLDKIHPAHRIHLRANGVWADDSHRVTHFMQAEETAVCRELAHRLPHREDRTWETAVLSTETACWQALAAALPDPYFDGAAVADALDLLPPGTNLFVGNSLPVRHVDQYGRSQPKPLQLYGNRGASGIDGNVSTALGIAAAGDAPLVMLLGDITFYHDMNGLLALRNTEYATGNVTIILLNNDGSGIFHRLPVAQFDPPFTELFLTPHGLDFEHTARLYGLDYVRVTDRESFRQAVVTAVSHPGPNLIELRTDSRIDDARRREINKIVNCQLSIVNGQ